jgi:hypothetical protein
LVFSQGGSHFAAPPFSFQISYSFLSSIITLSIFASSAAYHYQPIEPQKHSLLLTQLAEELILNAQDTLIHIILRVEDTLDDLDAVQEILVFLQSSTLASKGQIYSTVYNQPRICNSLVNITSVHHRLRKCRKYTKLSNIYIGIAKI